jgi:hypothetical protein
MTLHHNLDVASAHSPATTLGLHAVSLSGRTRCLDQTLLTGILPWQLIVILLLIVGISPPIAYLPSSAGLSSRNVQNVHYA